jgi:hypothetical protein
MLGLATCSYPKTCTLVASYARSTGTVLRSKPVALGCPASKLLASCAIANVGFAGYKQGTQVLYWTTTVLITG